MSHHVMNNSNDQWEYLVEAISNFLQATEMLISSGIEFKNDTTYQYFHRLRDKLYWLKNMKPGYDNEKNFFGVLWQMFAGGDSLHGYSDEDFVEQQIDSI